MNMFLRCDTYLQTEGTISSIFFKYGEYNLNIKHSSHINGKSEQQQLLWWLPSHEIVQV